MNVVQAVVLGIVQGLTEFLPISSTAHLKIVPKLLGWPDFDETAFTAFTAVIQLGTLLAVLVYFSRDIWTLTAAFVRGVVRGRPFGDPDARLAWMIALGTVPIVGAGLVFKENIESNLRSLYVMSAALILVALLMVAAEELVRIRQRSRSAEKDTSGVSWLDAFLVGVCQAFALIPGTSRSGVTITGGLFLGLSRESATRFSFLLSLPAIFAAAVLQLYKQREALLTFGVDNVLLATVTAGIVGYASIAFLLRFVKSHSLYLFVGYRLVLGVVLLLLLSRGVLNP